MTERDIDELNGIFDVLDEICMEPSGLDADGKLRYNVTINGRVFHKHLDAGSACCAQAHYRAVACDKIPPSFYVP